MVTTSGNLTAGTTINGQGGDGKGRFDLKAKLALGLAVLGCAGALAFGGLRATSEAPSQATTGASAAGSTHQVWGGACRPGGGVCIPDEDFAAQPQAPARAQQPVDASTSAQFRWAFGPESGVVAPDLAMLPPSRQNISA